MENKITFQVEDVETKRKKIEIMDFYLRVIWIRSIHLGIPLGSHSQSRFFPSFTVLKLSPGLYKILESPPGLQTAHIKSKYYHYQILSLLIFSQLFKLVKDFVLCHALLSGWLTFRDKSLFFAKGGELEDFGSITIKLSLNSPPPAHKALYHSYDPTPPPPLIL